MAVNLREYLKLRYMGDCKCGDCQLVPASVLAEAADELEILRARDRFGSPHADMAKES